MFLAGVRHVGPLVQDHRGWPGGSWDSGLQGLTPNGSGKVRVSWSPGSEGRKERPSMCAPSLVPTPEGLGLAVTLHQSPTPPGSPPPRPHHMPTFPFTLPSSPRQACGGNWDQPRPPPHSKPCTCPASLHTVLLPCLPTHMVSRFPNSSVLSLCQAFGTVAPMGGSTPPQSPHPCSRIRAHLAASLCRTCPPFPTRAGSKTRGPTPPRRAGWETSLSFVTHGLLPAFQIVLINCHSPS